MCGTHAESVALSVTKSGALGDGIHKAVVLARGLFI